MLRTLRHYLTNFWQVALALGSTLLLPVSGPGQEPDALQAGPASKITSAAKAEDETLLPVPTLVVTPVDEQVLALAFSPDGKSLVTAGARPQLPGQLKLWDVKTAKEQAAWQGMPGIRAVAYAPDGLALVTGDVAGKIKLLDLRTRQWFDLGAHAGGVNGMAFSADGSILASASLDRTVRLWDVKERKERLRLDGHADMAFSIAFFHHGGAVVSCGRDQRAIIWDVQTGGRKATLLGHDAGIEMVAVAPDDKLIATAGWDQTVRLWNAESGQEVAILAGAKSSILAVAFSPDGRFLAAGTGNGLVQLWDVATRQLVRDFRGHQAIVWTVAFSPDGKLLASGSSDRTAILWDVAGGTKVATLETAAPPLQPVLALACAPAAQHVAVATKDRDVQLRDAASGRLVRPIGSPTDGVLSLAYSPNGSQLAGGGNDAKVRVWDVESGKSRCTLQGHQGVVRALAYSPDGKNLASAGDDKTVRIWDLQTEQEVAVLLDHEGAVLALAYAPDGRTLASAGADSTIRIWDFSRKTAVNALRGHQKAVRALAYSPDGHTLASAGEDHTIKLWAPEQGDARLTLTGHAGEVLALAYAPGGRMLVSGGRDQTLRTWDPATGKARGTFSKHSDAVTALAFYPGGGYVLSGSRDCTVRRWTGTTATAAAALSAKAGPTPIETLPDEFYQDFRGNWKPAPPWRLVGPDADKMARPEANGLRITLPAQRPRTDAVGLQLDARIKGNFEVTAGFEILHADKPATGHGVGFELFVVTDTPTNESLGLLRAARVNEGEVYLTSRITSRDGKREYFHNSTPTTSKSGYLRLTRTGREARLWAADGAAGTFQELNHFDLGAEDLKAVRLSAYVGHTANAVDVLIKDLRVRGLSPTEVKTQTASTNAAAAPSRERTQGWLAASSIIAVLIALSTLGAWLYGRRKQSGAVAAPKAIFNSACPHCGKVVRARMELANKKVRCSGCKQIVRLPAR